MCPKHGVEILIWAIFVTCKGLPFSLGEHQVLAFMLACMACLLGRRLILLRKLPMLLSSIFTYTVSTFSWIECLAV